MTRLRFLTAGESHGPSLTGILEGLPAGLPLSERTLAHDLARRQRGFGAGGRMKIEQDHAHITGGVLGGLTTGAPIALTIANLDHAAWADRDIDPMTVPRPGHADLTAAVKYGYRDLRLGLERASARETAMRVAVGACCRALLAAFGIQIGGCVLRIGHVVAPSEPIPTDPETLQQRWRLAEASEVRCHDPACAAQMRAAIQAAAVAKDTLGGIVEVAAVHVPAGLGSHVHWDRRLNTRLMAAVASVQAVKGVEIGEGFAGAAVRGTEAHDNLFWQGDRIASRSNHAGGIEGGISNGAPIVLRAALKPIATTLTPQASVDLATGQAAPTRYERSDICQVPRAVPILEAMVAIELADALCEKLGGDSLAEMLPRMATLRQLNSKDLPMTAQPWRFGPA